MKKTIFRSMTLFGLLMVLCVLSACKGQESDDSSASKVKSNTTIALSQTAKPIPVITAPQSIPSSSTATPLTQVVSSNWSDNPEVSDILQKILRPDLPQMTFSQVKALFPTRCVADANKSSSITCLGLAGITSISFTGGPDGIFDMTFSGGSLTCNFLKKIVSQKFGKVEESDVMSSPDDAEACGAHWSMKGQKNRKNHINIRKIKDDDEVVLQIAAEQGP